MRISLKTGSRYTSDRDPTYWLLTWPYDYEKHIYNWKTFEMKFHEQFPSQDKVIHAIKTTGLIGAAVLFVLSLVYIFTGYSPWIPLPLNIEPVRAIGIMVLHVVGTFVSVMYVVTHDGFKKRD